MGSNPIEITTEAASKGRLFLFWFTGK